MGIQLREEGNRDEKILGFGGAAICFDEELWKRKEHPIQWMAGEGKQSKGEKEASMSEIALSGLRGTLVHRGRWCHPYKQRRKR